MPTTEKERYARLRPVFHDVAYMGTPYLEPLRLPAVQIRSADPFAHRRRSRSREGHRDAKSAGYGLLLPRTDYQSSDNEEVRSRAGSRPRKTSKSRKTGTPRQAFVRSNLRGSHNYRNSVKRNSKPKAETSATKTYSSQPRRPQNGPKPVTPKGQRRSSASLRSETTADATSHLLLDVETEDEDEHAPEPRRSRSRQRNRSRQGGALYKRNMSGSNLRNLSDSIYCSAAPSREGSVCSQDSLPPTPRTHAAESEFDARSRRTVKSRQSRRSATRKRSSSRGTPENGKSRGWELPPLRVNQTPLPVLPRKTNTVTADDLETIRKQVEESLGSYYTNVRRHQVDHAKQGYDELLPRDIPTPHLRHAFSQAFWTYSPQTEPEAVTKPWLPAADSIRGTGGGGTSGRQGPWARTKVM